jgi:hypothetical protein
MAQDVNLTIEDGGLGATPVSTDEISTIMGTASAGPINTPIFTRSAEVVRSTFGYGPLVEAACFRIQATGAPVGLMRVTTNTAGASAAVAHSGAGTSVVTATGTPVDTYEIDATFSVGGTIGVAGILFTYSVDGGRTRSPVVALGTATTYTVPDTGVTLNFAAGTILAGQVESVRTTAPLWNAAGLTAAFAALAAQPQEWGFVHIVGPAAASDAVVVSTAMAAAATTSFRYAFALLEARDVNLAEPEATWSAALIADYASFSSVRVSVAAGHYLTTSAINGRRYRRSLAWGAAARAVSQPVHRDLAAVADGAISGQNTKLASEYTDTSVYHDEQVNPGLDAARFLTATTRVGEAGLFIKNPNMMAPAGSDYSLLQFRRVMDKASRISRAFWLKFLSLDVRLDPKTGYILEKDAADGERRSTRALANGLITEGNASAVRTVAARDDVLTGAGARFHVKIRILPKGYLKDIELDLAFENPALAA